MPGLILLTTALAVGLVSGQPATTAPDLVDTITSAAAAAYTNPLIQSLWSDAVSLINTYHPSESVTNVASLTWPSTVVLGSATIALTPSPTTLSTAISSTPASVSSPVPTSIENNAVTSTTSSGPSNDNPKKSNHTDKRLGIALGVGLGLLAVAVMVFLIWLLHRRKKKTGSFARHRPKSVSDSEIDAWRTPSFHSSQQFPEKYPADDAPVPPMPPMPAMRSHPAYHHGWEDGNTIGTTSYHSSNGGGNPFQTPYETYAELSAENSYQTSPHELQTESNTHMLDNERRPRSLITRAALSAVQPPTTSSTAYSPAATQEEPMSPVSPIDDSQHRGFWRNDQDYIYTPHNQNKTESGWESQTGLHYDRSSASNPFLSEEDDEHIDSPPRVPTRSPHRRSLPAVHYPSGDELSTFDFGLVGERRLWGSEQQADGGDGWTGPAGNGSRNQRRESIVGRHEMQ